MARKIGLIAGGGTIPSMVAEAVLRQGDEICVAAFAGITNLESILSVRDSFKPAKPETSFC